MDKCKELTCPKLPGLRHVLEEIIMDEKRLLIVDDEKHIRMLYSSEFEALGYAVATSDGLEDIKRVLNREKPHVIVLDINLGASHTGLDLLEVIRKMDSRIPVVLCTAYESYQHDAKSSAADYYVVKSVDLSQLKDKVAMAMDKATFV